MVTGPALWTQAAWKDKYKGLDVSTVILKSAVVNMTSRMLGIFSNQDTENSNWMPGEEGLRHHPPGSISIKWDLIETLKINLLYRLFLQMFFHSESISGSVWLPTGHYNGGSSSQVALTRVPIYVCTQRDARGLGSMEREMVLDTGSLESCHRGSQSVRKQRCEAGPI